uniref:F-box only protein 8 n=2 Tax=Dromaius novaehollandiae TaxID=8790 RepID=A0A8C4IZ48_DRONO
MDGRRSQSGAAVLGAALWRAGAGLAAAARPLPAGARRDPGPERGEAARRGGGRGAALRGEARWRGERGRGWPAAAGRRRRLSGRGARRRRSPGASGSRGSVEAGSQMGQGLWRVARNQQLQHQGYSGQGYLTREHGRRIATNSVSNTSHRKQAQGGIDIYHLLKTRKSKEQEGFINLEMLPPELSFTILSYLNATDLCLASCVWQDLANDELLWQGLCKSTWGHCSIYNKNPPLGFSFRKLYMQLDEGSLTFNANPDEGVNYFMSKGILDDSPKEIAKFIFCTRTLNWKKLRIYLDERRDVLDDLVTLHNFRNQFLPNALREFFRHIHAPEERGEYLETLITKFSHRFCACNPDLMREHGLSPDAVYVLCYSLILLSIDLTSPHVKNKMSKREFIRNTRRAAQNISEDFVGHLYDNIYLIGHVAA